MAITLAVFNTCDYYEAIGDNVAGKNTSCLHVEPETELVCNDFGDPIKDSNGKNMRYETGWADLVMEDYTCVLGKDRHVPARCVMPLEAFEFAHKHYGLIAFYVDGLQLWPLPVPEPVDGEQAGEGQSEKMRMKSRR